MAGAGYKLFNTGDVLTAAQVNTYLMEQTVMVFADAAARTTALTGVVSEGMISYLKDTNAVEVYNGSAWVASDDPNAIQNTIVDAKGDLIAASANDTPARLAVGSNGDTLLADSSATTGLRWGSNLGFTAGKNKIINGDFGIWQRGTSFAASAGYTADRMVSASDATIAQTRQTFTAGTAPVAGYEGTYFFRMAKSAGGSYSSVEQKIEDVRTFAGQTVTFSFWLKSSAATTIRTRISQNFGSGGSTPVDNTATDFTSTTSWARYSLVFNLASIAGKTIGTSSFLNVAIINVTSSAVDVDVWGMQLESGSVATAFQTATGTLAGELAACERYYWRPSGQSAYAFYGMGVAESGTVASILIPTPVNLRNVGTASIDYSNLAVYDASGTVRAVTSMNINHSQSNCLQLLAYVASGLTQYRPAALLNNNSTSAYLAISSEL